MLLRVVLQELASQFRRMWEVGRKNIAYAARWGTLLWVGTALCVNMGISDIWGVSVIAFGVCQLYHARFTSIGMHYCRIFTWMPGKLIAIWYGGGTL